MPLRPDCRLPYPRWCAQNPDAPCFEKPSKLIRNPPPNFFQQAAPNPCP